MTNCDVDSCLWYKELEEKHYLGEGKLNYVPFEDNSYSGTCTRPEGVFISMKKFESHQMKYEWPCCMSFSHKKIKGHMDWSRFPQGGHISPPADPGTVTPSRFCNV